MEGSAKEAPVDVAPQGGEAQAEAPQPQEQQAQQPVTSVTPQDRGLENEAEFEKQSEEKIMADAEDQADDPIPPDGEEKPEEEGEDADKTKAELEELRKYKEANTKANERLLEIFDEYPELAGIIRDLDKGADLRVALARHLDIDELKPLDDEPNVDDWKKAREERLNKRKERETFSQRMEENINFSRAEIEAFKKENNLNEQQAQGFFDTVNNLLDQIFEGKVDRKFLSMLHKAQNADKMAEEARKMGEIKGKNEKIEAMKEESKKKAGDGLPSLGKGANTGAPPEPRKVKTDAFAEAIDREKSRQRF